MSLYGLDGGLSLHHSHLKSVEMAHKDIRTCDTVYINLMSNGTCKLQTLLEEEKKQQHNETVEKTNGQYINFVMKKSVDEDSVDSGRSGFLRFKKHMKGTIRMLIN